MRISRAFLAAMVCGLLLAQPVQAVQVVTDDLSIEDRTPSLIFNDTTVLDAQYEWFIRGWDEYFSIMDVAAGKHVLYVNRSAQRMDLNYTPSINSRTPLLIFDDTTVADGQVEWFIRGRDEFFAITDVAAGEQLFLYDKLKGGALSLGGGAAATGHGSVALGVEASSVGERSAALGESASATGFLSVAVGPNTSSAGNFSTVIGHGAYSGSQSGIAIGGAASTGTRIPTWTTTPRRSRRK